MKSDLKVKYLQYLSQKEQDEGFTLIELLVVIVIIGILSAVALPSFLNQGNKAKETEAAVNISAVNQAQEIFRIQPGNTQFASALGDLDVGIDTDTSNYNYAIPGTVSATYAGVTAEPDDEIAVRGLSGAIALDNGQIFTTICKKDDVGNLAAPEFTASSGTTSPWGCKDGTLQNQ